MNWKTEYKKRLIDNLTNASKQGIDAFVKEINRSSCTFDLYVCPERDTYEVVRYMDGRTELLLETESIMKAIHYFVDSIVATAE